MLAEAQSGETEGSGGEGNDEGLIRCLRCESAKGNNEGAENDVDRVTAL